MTQLGLSLPHRLRDSLLVWPLILVSAACAIEIAPTATAVSEELVPAVPVSAANQIPALEPYTDLRSDEQAIVDLFEDTSPSVVYISTVTRRRDVFGRGVNVPQGSGTGFVWNEDGHIVTNFHVIQGAAQARVVMHDQTGYLAEWVGGSERHDLAVLRIDAPRDRLQRVRTGDSDRVRVG